MRKGQMIELIQKLIHDEAVGQLKKKRAASPHDPPDLSDEELDGILFHGGMPTLKEDFDRVAKINQSDITAFEQKMNEIVSGSQNAVLNFDQQKNGHSILLKNENGVSVVASGNISLGGDGEIRWMFSIPNGFRVETSGLKVTPMNRDLIADMANYYDSWQKDWRAKLLAPDGGESMQAANGQGPAAPMAGQQGEMPGGPEAPPGGAPNPMGV